MAQQILLIHGGDTFDTYEQYLSDLRAKEVSLERLKGRDWKSTLGEKLGPDFEVLAPRMPNAQNAKYLEWKIWFEKIIPFMNDDVMLIGHSLGGIFLAKYLAEEKFSKKIKATFLIAAPYGVGADKSLADFVLRDDLRLLGEQCGELNIYHSQDDPVVPFSNCEQYQKAFPQAHVRIFADRQHFNQAELPEIIVDLSAYSHGAQKRPVTTEQSST